MLYDFTNKEQERVRKVFQTGNFYSLRELPNFLLAGNVGANIKGKQEFNVNMPVEQKTYVELQNGGGLFSKFDWMPDPFDNCKYLHLRLFLFSFGIATLRKKAQKRS